MAERTEPLEFSDIVGIRKECNDCGTVTHYTLSMIAKLNLIDAVRCPRCLVLPAEMPSDWGWMGNASVLLDTIQKLAAMQLKEPRPKFKLSFDVRCS